MTPSTGMAIVEDQDGGDLCLTKQTCAFLMKWRPDGTTAWAREFGVNETAQDPTILLAADATNLWIATSRNTTINFGPGDLTPSPQPAGNQDVLVGLFPLASLPK